MVDHHGFLSLRGKIHQFERLRFGIGHWFFNQHVFVLLESLLREFVVH